MKNKWMKKLSAFMAVVMAAGPVSYTHLDVYKRQGQGVVKIIGTYGLIQIVFRKIQP